MKAFTLLPSDAGENMVAFATDILHRQLDLLGQQSENWRADREKPIACRELEEVISFSNYVYERIRGIDAEWSAELDAAGTEAPLAEAKALEALYARWRDRAKANLQRAAEFLQAGHPVRGADRLWEFDREAEGILSVPAERIRQAADGIKEGHGRPLAEVRDELLRRFGTPGRAGS